MVVDALDRTVAGLSEHATEFLLSATVPERDGFLQAVHPVAKLVGLFALVLLCVATDDGRVLAALLGLAAALAVASRVPLRTFAKRVAVPAATALVAVAPQAVLMEGPAVATLPMPVVTLTVTDPGVAYVVAFVVRVLEQALHLEQIELLLQRLGVGKNVVL